MRHASPTTILRQDYQAYPFQIPSIELEFDLAAETTRVISRLHVQRKPDAPAQAALVLDGEALTLQSIHVDGQLLDANRYQVDDASGTLRIDGLPADAQVQITSLCRPAQNTTLMGLYVSGASLFTQCEAEGFRRITWFADRPDVMSRYRVTLRASQADYPLLLSNGNLIETTTLDGGRHQAVWEDPHPKPCYLFALVAGQFDCRESRLRTRSGREALLQVYADPGSGTQTAWALESLERSVRWDEQRFGLELDLDRLSLIHI